MESLSRFGIAFEDEDDDEEVFGKKECTSQKELTMKVDGKNNEQKTSTPRSKHSATEQRRRSKINDRFQMLIGLLPNSDQKRDKASFLLEVIEYIQFLQAKIHKYDPISTGWSDENARLMLLNNRHDAGDLSDDPQLFKNGASSSSGLLMSDMASHSEWLKSSLPVDCAVSNYFFDEHEELTIDEETVRASDAYSQGLLNTLSQSLQNSGIDLSQANISVNINLGRRSGCRHNTSTSITAQKDQDEPSSCNLVMGQALAGNRSDESEAAAKRHKLDHIVTHL
ncbi:transcription factor BIM1-like [Phalaenopsis equestris]|uniref:transcription factor BIM1-like n=1 Tax=Phalaenopsis equestris TaxID=78828 RepID=UPI0009E5D14E|nr:transcription factor BIM1-like [Phalaenopsis equestris]